VTEVHTRAEARIHIAAPAERVYALVSDLTRMGEWSPETTGVRWVDGATTAVVGAWFEGTNRARATWTTRCQIDVAEPAREIAWIVHAGGAPSSRWSYRFEATDDGGTDLIESMEGYRANPPLARVIKRIATGIGDRGKHNEAGMRATLARIKAAAEA
jgi:uncharacterized protein YndB with AHSA1/START domain